MYIYANDTECQMEKGMDHGYIHWKYNEWNSDGIQQGKFKCNWQNWIQTKVRQVIQWCYSNWQWVNSEKHPPVWNEYV